MSASIYWQTLEASVLPGTTPGTTWSSLMTAFGGGRMQLDGGSLPVLEGMIAAANDPKPYEAIRDAITEHGVIRVWVEY